MFLLVHCDCLDTVFGAQNAVSVVENTLYEFPVAVLILSHEH